MKPLLKWSGRVLGVLVLLVLIGLAVLYYRSEALVDRVYDVPGRAVSAVPDSAALARAEHFVHSIYGCASCHGENLAGRVMFDAPPGRFVAANLTPGGVGAYYTDEDWDRAIRHGLRPDGTSLIIMGSDRFGHIADVDFAALLAYLKHLPPVTNELPSETLRPLGRFLLGMGIFLPAAAKIDHEAPPPPFIEPDTTAVYGRFLASISCVECHGANLRGGPHPDPAGPYAPDLAASGAWPTDVFIQTIRTGTTPDGRQLNPEYMPWRELAPLTDGELTALHAYLQTIPDQAPPAKG